MKRYCSSIGCLWHFEVSSLYSIYCALCYVYLLIFFSHKLQVSLREQISNQFINLLQAFCSKLEKQYLFLYLELNCVRKQRIESFYYKCITNSCTNTERSLDMCVSTVMFSMFLNQTTCIEYYYQHLPALQSPLLITRVVCWLLIYN